MPDAAVDLAEENPFAQLFDLLGMVEWRRGEVGEWKNANNAKVLAVEDAIRTGERSRAGIRFADGRSLVLEAKSELALNRIGDGFALLLGQGEVEVTAGASSAGFRLVFGDSSEYVMIQDGQARLSRDEDGVRIQMIMGRATLGGGDEDRTLSSGESFQLTFGQAEIEEAKDLETRLRDRSRKSRVKAPDARRFVRPSTREMVLPPSSEIRVGSAPVALTDDLGGNLQLSAKSKAVYLGARQSPEGRFGKIKLQAGQARVQLRRGQLKGSSEEVSTPHAEIRARTRGLTADVQVSSHRKGTVVQVHAGAADVLIGDKRHELLAGQMLSVDRKGATGGPRSLGSALVWAKEGLRTRIFYDRRLSGIGFSFASIPEGEKAWIEIATQRDFDQALLSEPVTGKRFVYRRLSPRRFFWRIRRGEEPGRTGLLELSRDPTLGMKAAGGLTNVVRDTGIQTKIYFQGSVPALTFRWEQVEGAASYGVRIYAEDNLEKPLVAKDVVGTIFKLTAGKLGEGTYYWYQSAKDAGGKELRSSQMNKLLLEFQNAAPLLRIDAATPAGARGMAAKGASLQINDSLVSLDKNGRFDAKLNLPKGRPAIFHLRKPGAGDVVFLRTVK